MEVIIPYGSRQFMVQIPERNLVGVFGPNPVETFQEQKVVSRALNSPLGSPSFSDFISGAGEVLFIVNDATRPTPTAKILALLHKQLGGANLRFIIATGIHRPPTNEELRLIFGGLYERYRDQVIVHDACAEGEMVYMGTSAKGTEIYLNRWAEAADKLVTIGSVEPHYFAGYTGGRKALLPGIASRHTITQNHRFALRPEARAMSLSGNPVHEDMVDALSRFQGKPIFSIQTVIDRERRIYAAAAGNIHASLSEMIPRAREVYGVRIPRKADIVVAVARYPLDVDLYQSQKAIESGKHALNQGGILLLVSSCRAGIGDKTFFDLLGMAKEPEQILERIQEEYILGYHKAAKIAEISCWADIWAVTDLPEEEVRQAFMRPFRGIQAAVDAAIRQKGSSASLLILMDACNSMPILPEAGV